MAQVDLNCDMGESFGVYTMGDDAAMLDIVSTANIACGFHAGDPLVMHTTLSIAKKKGVAVGAHPSFLDLWGFGRRPILGERPADIEKHIIYQIGAIQAMAASIGHPITHVKTHGSLGNMAAEDADLAGAVVNAIKAVDRDLIFLTLPYAETEKAGRAADLRIASEVFADRTYEDNGQLTSRRKDGAIIHDAEHAAARVLRMVEDGEIVSTSGKRLPVRVDSICVHGDNPNAVAMARTIRTTLEAAGVTIAPFARRDA